MLLESIDIDSKKVVKLAELLFLQLLEFQTIYKIPDVKHLSQGLQSIARWIYTQNNKVEPCHSCQQGYSLFESCVVMGIKKTLPFRLMYINCFFNNNSCCYLFCKYSLFF